MSKQLQKIEISINQTVSLLEKAIDSNDTKQENFLRNHFQQLNQLKLSLLS